MDINILVVEDDEDINNLIRDILRRSGYRVSQAFSGSEASLLLRMEDFNLVILDLMLPGVKGEDLVEQIREKSNIPIIIVSAKLDVETKVGLLEQGADDFISKPFDNKELLARVGAQLRRYLEYSSEIEEIREFKNLRLLDEERRVLIGEEDLKLTATEYDILKLFLDNPKKVFSKGNIYASIWGDNAYMDENTLNVHISNIRNKIAKYDDEEYIKTIWGIGFKLNS